MANLMAFLSWFASYFLLFAIMVVLAVLGTLTGIRIRRATDAKAAVEETDEKEKGR